MIMFNKQNYLKLIFSSFIFIISCANDLSETVWKTADGQITLSILSKNLLEINNNVIQKKFLFYKERDYLILTNNDDFSQYKINIKDGNKLIVDSEIILKTDNKLSTKFIFEKISK
jgi:hypothetical protein